MKPLTSKTKPFSIRFTDDERAKLERAAGSKPLGAFVRGKLLDDHVSPRKAMSKPQKDYRLLAQILAVLGSSELSANMRELSEAARIGALAETPDTIRDINAACMAIEKIRLDLIKALGLRQGDK